MSECASDERPLSERGDSERVDVLEDSRSESLLDIDDGRSPKSEEGGEVSMEFCEELKRAISWLLTELLLRECTRVFLFIELRDIDRAF